METQKPSISPLRQRMIDDMRMRKFGEKTQLDYVRAVRKFAQYLGRSPDLLEFGPDLLGRRQILPGLEQPRAFLGECGFRRVAVGTACVEDFDVLHIEIR